MKKMKIIVFFTIICLFFEFMTSYRASLKDAYNKGVHYGYAEGYLKRKYYPQSNEFFIYDENLGDYISHSTEVFITTNKLYHRKGCVLQGRAVEIKNIIHDYLPCAKCKPPVILQ